MMRMYFLKTVTAHFWVDTENKITAVYMKNSYYDGGAGAQTANWFEEDVMNSLQ